MIHGCFRLEDLQLQFGDEEAQAGGTLPFACSIVTWT